MADHGRRWTVQDRDANSIYLTQERWSHIVKHHPEMADFEEHLRVTVRRGRRRQELLNPRKYRYLYPFDDLPEEFNHVVAIVLFGFDVASEGQTSPNNYVATAFMKHIRLKGDEA